MNLYECRRHKEYEMTWMGALLIAAPNIEEAKKKFIEIENNEPNEIEQIEGVQVKGKVRVIYNDDMR